MVGIESSKLPAVEFAGSVPAAMRPAVESLFFFNPRQSAVIDQIREAVEKTGHLRQLHGLGPPPEAVDYSRAAA